MKSLLITTLLLFCLNTFSQKQVAVEPPSKLKDSVEAIYGKVQGVKWYLDDNNNYTAKFVHNGQNISIIYSEKGKSKETRTEVKSKEIPSKIHGYITKEFPSDLYVKNKIDKVEYVENKDSKFYYITLSCTGVKEPVELWFKTTGDLIKQNIPKEYTEKKLKRTPEDKKSLDEKILKDDFSSDDDATEEKDPTEELDGKKKKKK